MNRPLTGGGWGGGQVYCRKEVDMRSRIIGTIAVLIVSFATTGIPRADAYCFPEPNYFCGVSCGQWYYCSDPGDEHTICVETQAGCGSSENADCCPPCVHNCGF